MPAVLTFALTALMPWSASAGAVGAAVEAETETSGEASLEDIEVGEAVIVGGVSTGEDILGILPPVEEEEEEEGYVIALDDLNISIRLKDFVSVRQDEDGFVYIHTLRDGSIPYVIVGSYDIPYEKVADAFTNLMSDTYEDLDVDALIEGIEIGDLEFTKVIYQYTISGYDAVDTRLFCDYRGTSYMFGMKEVEDLDFTVGEDYLKAVAGSIEQLAGGFGDYEYHVDADHDSLLFEDLDQGGVGGGGKDIILRPEESTESGEDAGKTFNEEDAPYEGIWIPFEDGFMLYLPTDWNWLELTQEQQQSGVLVAAGDASVGEPMPFINVAAAYEESVSSMEELAEIIEAGGYTVEEIGMVNDLECLVYHDPTGVVRGEMFMYPLDEESGYFFALVANNYDRDEETFDSILLSLSRYEEE